MRFNKLGRTGLLVSEMGLGTTTFSGSDEVWGTIGRLGQTEADDLVRIALDGGVNLIDTADIYANGASERMVGQALRNLSVARDAVVVATKAFGPTGPGPNQRGASRLHLIEACHASLRRLQLDHVDLYQVHNFDPATPIEESLRALDALVQNGHVRYVGVSNWAAWQITKALGLSARHDPARFEALQAYYSVAGRDVEREIVPMLRSEEVGPLVWSPLAGGLLSGKFDQDAEGPAAGEGRRARFDFPPVDATRGRAVVAAMRGVAATRSVSVAQVALAWLLHQPVVTSVIVGAKRPDQLRDNLGASDVVLTADDLTTLSQAGELPPEYPGWMMAQRAEIRAGRTPPRSAQTW